MSTGRPSRPWLVPWSCPSLRGWSHGDPMVTWPCRWAASRMLALDSCQSPYSWSSCLINGKDPGSDGFAWPFFQTGETEVQDTQPKSQAPTIGLLLMAQPLHPAGGLAQAVPVTRAGFGDPPSHIFKLVFSLDSCQTSKGVQPFGSEV